MKMFGIAVGVVAAVIALLHLTGNSLGGPRLHGHPPAQQEPGGR
jgi:hypothetical protein